MRPQFTDMEHLTDTEDTKNMYNLTNELLDRKNANSPQQLVLAGRLIRKPIEIANALIEYYDTKVRKILEKIPTSLRNPHRFLDNALESWTERGSFPQFEFKSVTLAETFKILQTLSNSTAMGHDFLDSKGIKDCGGQLVPQIRHLINVSLITGKFANKWKFAKLSPLLKSTDLDRTSVKSYCAVAILPVASKIVERAAQLQLLNYFESTAQLNNSSHAYRKHFSTTTTLMEILDELHQGAEDRNMTSLMTLDLTAAFDTVSHRLLVEKLQRYNVGPADGWSTTCP